MPDVGTAPQTHDPAPPGTGEGGGRPPLRIGIFTDYYLPSVGGTERAVDAQRRMLESLGHEVFVVTTSEPGRDRRDERVVEVRSFGVPTTPYRISTPPRGTVRSLRRLDLDVVHAHTQFVVGGLADAVARDQDVPLVSTTHTLVSGVVAYHPWAALALGLPVTVVHSAYLRRTGRTAQAAPAVPFPQDLRTMQRWAWGLMIRFANTATVVTTPSEHLHRSMRAFGAHRPHVVLPNAVESREFAAPREALSVPLEPAKLRVVTVGRVEAEKRTAELIRAFARVPERLGAQLVVVGEGAELGACRKLARRLGIGDRVVFTGVLPRAQVAALLAASDVFVMASQGFDNQPMVVLEAASAGLPIVYCDPALTEGLTPENAVLAESPEPAAMADAITAVLSDDRRRAAMAEASRRVGAEFDSSVMRYRLDEVYRMALTLHASRV